MSSKCGSCGGLSWEISEEAPRGSNYKLFFVRCTFCKVPVGVAEYYNNGAQLEEVKKTLTVLGNSLTGMLQVIDQNIRRLFQK